MASDPQSWAELESALGAWLDQDVGAAQLRQFIALAERHLNRSVFTPDRESELSITADAQAEALPTDFWGFKSGPYVDASSDVALVRLTPGDLRATYPDGTTGTPAHYAIEGETILFGPIPSSAAIKGTYYATIPALGASQSTNWLLTDHPDLYLAAALVEAFAFNMDEARVNFWSARRDDKIADVNRAGARRSANSGPLVATHSIGQIPNILS